MSSFSSWGVPGNLSMKPEITAPGGSIYSLEGTMFEPDAYTYMSGTSMASPQVAGLTALVKQYLEEQKLSQPGLTNRALTQSLLMSTAEPMLEEASGYYYSILRQGAGLAAVDQAIGAASYILVDGQPDGKVKAELKDDPDRTGVYAFSFTLHDLRGQDTPCIVTVTYGNRDFDDALLELTRFCQERGFLPFAGAALVGEHTYGSIALGRPDAEDLLQDRAFALEAWEDFQAGWESFSPPGNFPYKEGGKGGSFTPSTTQACTHCGLCVRQCPMQAIGEDCAAIDGEKCIACFRCVKNCPVQAKGVFTPEYQSFAAAFSEKLKEPKENQYFLGRG